MSRPIVKDKEELGNEWKLTAQDRCDKCGAQAYVQITGMSGDLMFCNHHYDKIMNDPLGYSKMRSFMIHVVDERHRLNENKLIGSHN